MIRRFRWLVPWGRGNATPLGILTAVFSQYPNEIGEKSSAVINVAFADQAGNAWAPESLTWSLTDDLGNVINSRNAVAITPAPSVSILLAGNDLVIGSNGVYRALLIHATYESTLGASLPLRAQYKFQIDNWVGVL